MLACTLSDDRLFLDRSKRLYILILRLHTLLSFLWVDATKKRVLDECFVSFKIELDKVYGVVTEDIKDHLVFVWSWAV